MDEGDGGDQNGKYLEIEAHRRKIKGYIDLLKSPHLDSRWKAAEALGGFGDQTAVVPLIEALDGNIGDERALNPLEKARSDPDESVRSAAELAIKTIRMKQASTGTTPDSDS